jgi:ATP-dependent Clp protease ATP-binding subunit ClpC
MTSNAGTKDVKAGGKIGFTDMKESSDYENMKSTIEDTVKQLFNPEFINRIDEFIVFHSLNKEQIIEIVDLNLSEIIERMRVNNISLELTVKAKEFLANEGYDEKYGARPLRRQIQNHVENELAEEILKGNLPPFSTVIADFDKEKNGIVFNISLPESTTLVENTVEQKYFDESISIEESQLLQ